MSVTDVTERDVRLPDGRTLHAYDARPGGGPEQLTVVWHHGTPNVGAPPRPLFDAARRLGVRFVSYDRPGYGGSTPVPDRPVGSAAADVEAVADALGVPRFAVLGHSGGGPHALACAALLPDRVTAAVSAAGLAPFDADGLEWFAGMAPSGEASLRAAAAGRAAKEHHERTAAPYDPQFTPADLAALHGDWAWFDEVVGPAAAQGPAPLVDDDLAYVAPWGFDPADVRAPVLLLHGTDDRVVPPAHAHWLAAHLPDAELRVVPGTGHISVLTAAPDALTWLVERTGAR
ncbi:alpha/beta fold hydrolase [Cellulomonas fimi]|uniref:Alpha/beta hydrolase fold protein n=1 Tax=Cellulomonas fimi (strain ATCC 484 / DSM 20113 / JCM 1341 / CCUG 24087 / LMG 16345 / NBRC 15513 / NCIMB 8980 / NCTC 7547 / NRS-133) TaxID=590998 RepID=F4GYF7_CELFA|nr:alpha/beta fold hydrolase [Cellulomonas fimi]AEE45946.1 alpha/beta hydrolase fold protein [Cellulomonas fimi ATCC 484]NNH06532.1 alpha/beta fold hydrolase [Cellulomonas fimi]VEH31081.1 Proline iminopeptidase [Cellulomonas fimi]